MTERAKERSAICTRLRLFQFTRMLFGLARALASFCRLVFIVFNDHNWKVCLSYLDYITVFTRTPEELLEREVGFKVKPSKCVFFKRDTEFLGHVSIQFRTC